MPRNKNKYPKIVLLDSSGHYPSVYMQVTEEEAKLLEEEAGEWDGSFGADDSPFQFLYNPRGEDGDGNGHADDRVLRKSEVDVLPRDINEYCEYC